MIMPVILIGLPVGGTPIALPVCVPVAVRRTTVLSPSCSTSSTVM